MFWVIDLRRTITKTQTNEEEGTKTLRLDGQICVFWVGVQLKSTLVGFGVR